MFNNLLESKAKKPKSPGGAFVSAALHVLIIFLAIKATLNAGQKKEKVEEKVDFVEVKKDVPPPPKVKQPEVVVAPPPKGFQTLTAPVNIPDVLPDIDLTKKVTNEADFTGKGAAGGRDKGVVGAPPSENQTYFEYQVEKPVMPAPGSPSPRYPDILKSAGVEGEVVVSFTVDTTGRVLMSTLNILKSTHELFAAAVRSALPTMRFLPAEVGGKKVKQLVQQPFVFNIVK
ncbi:MAG TPA: TonB family protein [Gemmatimonadaceae bacterium]